LRGEPAGGDPSLTNCGEVRSGSPPRAPSWCAGSDPRRARSASAWLACGRGEMLSGATVTVYVSRSALRGGEGGSRLAMAPPPATSRSPPAAWRRVNGPGEGSTWRPTAPTPGRATEDTSGRRHPRTRPAPATSSARAILESGPAFPLVTSPSGKTCNDPHRQGRRIRRHLQTSANPSWRRWNRASRRGSAAPRRSAGT